MDRPTPALEAEQCRQQAEALRHALAEVRQARQRVRQAEGRIRRLLLACGYVGEEGKKDAHG
jgi:hypothetical protein